MRIRVQYNKVYKSLNLPAVLITQRKRVMSKFIIDTGSPHTILNYGDSLRLNIPHNEKSEVIRIGGRVYQSYIFNNLQIIFKSFNGEEVRQSISVRVLKPNSLKSNELENLDRIPNILDLDFLELGYNFSCDLVNDEVFLQKSD